MNCDFGMKVLISVEHQPFPVARLHHNSNWKKAKKKAFLMKLCAFFYVKVHKDIANVTRKESKNHLIVIYDERNVEHHNKLMYEVHSVFFKSS